MSNWNLFEHMIVRTTGFPWDHLDDLSQPETLAAVRKRLDCENQMDAFRAKGRGESKPHKKVVKAIKFGRPVDLALVEEPENFTDWNQVVGEAQNAEADFSHAFERELAAARSALHRFVEDERVQEAIACTSPPVYLDIRKGKRDKRLERQLAAYMQRFCAKNETMSFFGSINYGVADPSLDEKTDYRWSGPERICKRRAHLGSPLVRFIEEQISQDPEIVPFLTPRPKAFKKAPLSSEKHGLLYRLVHCADGAKTMKVIAEELETNIEELLPFMSKACRQGFLTHQLEIPAASFYPIEDLIERISGLPGRCKQKYLELLVSLLDQMEAYSAASAETKVILQKELPQKLIEALPQPADGERSLPQKAKESQGKFYADRLPLREECSGDMKLVIGGAPAKKLVSKIDGYLDLLGSAALATRDVARKELARLLGKKEIPFWKVVMGLAQKPLNHAVAIQQRIAEQLKSCKEREFDLASLDLEPDPRIPDEPMICSIDLLIEAERLDHWPDKGARLFLGDTHDTALVWGWALQFNEHSEQITNKMVTVFGNLAGSIPRVNLLASRRSGLPPSEFPGPLVELGGVSKYPSRWLLPFDDLIVVSDGETVSLHSQSIGTEVALYNGELESLVHTAFSIPRIRELSLDLGEYTPRLLWNDVVVQRERWRPASEKLAPLLEAKNERAAYQEVVSFASRLNLPDQFFAKFIGERKPIMVDLRSPLIVRVFLNLLRSRNQVILSEMRPAPSGLWLRSGKKRFTSEFRCTFWRMSQ